MAIYRNISVPVPPEAYVRKKQGIVYVVREHVYLPDKRYNENKTTDIGRINSPDGKTMNPNDNYAELYPAQFNEAAKGKSAPAIRRVGLFACTAAITRDNGLYQALIDACGPEDANFLLDFAMYSIQTKSNVARDFDVLMSENVLFSRKNYSDSWISDFFKNKLSIDSVESFKENWIQRCISNGKNKVWLCVDGTNNDCSSENTELAEKGKAKSKKNVNIYSLMYAVDANDGTPVYYQLDRGGKADAKAFLRLEETIRSYGMEIEGVILDRGFCEKGIFNLVIERKYKYVIMMTENLCGFKTALAGYGKTIRNNADYLVAPGIFACTSVGRVFKDYPHDSYITLVFDTVNGSERILTYSQKILRETEACQAVLDSGKNIPENDHFDYVDITEDGAGYSIRPDVQKEMDKKGFSALACSEKDYSAKKILETYDLRDASEKQFSVLKTQLGFHTARAHSTEGIEGRHLAAFIAGIIRNEFFLKCKSCGYDLTRALKELHLLVLHRVPDNHYMMVHNENKRQLNLLEKCSLSEEDFEYIAQQESRHMNGEIYDQIIQLPSKREPVQKTGPGRRKGSKNKKTKAAAEPAVKRRPGRPKGSKNKKNIENQEETPEPVKKTRGRPKGSRDKTPRTRRWKKKPETAER